MTTQAISARPLSFSGLRWVHRISTGWLVLLMLSGGALDAFAVPEAMAVFSDLGYPAYFARILGVAKLLGVVALLAPVPRFLREWAYAGFVIDVSCAILSLLAVGHAVTALGIPLLALALVLTSYASSRAVTSRAQIL
ncbi:MAG TPA: DoxX family protein [Polyangiales bacterium]